MIPFLKAVVSETLVLLIQNQIVGAKSFWDFSGMYVFLKIISWMKSE